MTLTASPLALQRDQLDPIDAAEAAQAAADDYALARAEEAYEGYAYRHSVRNEHNPRWTDPMDFEDWCARYRPDIARAQGWL
jgi:hypothetical protein